MKRLVFRILVLLVVVPSAYYFIYWLPLSLINLNKQPWIGHIVAFFCAALLGWYVWKRIGSGPSNLIKSVLFGAIVLGGLGFAAGFFGPLIFIPDANQGPLLGIFITGPLGFLLGGIGGFVYWLVRGRKSGMNQPT